MDKKQIAWYLIFGGGVIVLFTFITTIFHLSLIIPG